MRFSPDAAGSSPSPNALTGQIGRSRRCKEETINAISYLQAKRAKLTHSVNKCFKLRQNGVALMPIPTTHDQQADLGQLILPVVLLSVVATLATIASVALFFWSGNIDPQVSAALRNIPAAQQQATSAIAAINDRPAAEDQYMALSAHLSTLQDAMTRIQRDNANLAQQLRATQTQMAQDHALVAEQLKALTQMMARGASILAMGSDEGERRRRTMTRKPMPEVSGAEVSGALAARRPAGAILGKFPSNSQ